MDEEVGPEEYAQHLAEEKSASGQFLNEMDLNFVPGGVQILKCGECSQVFGDLKALNSHISNKHTTKKVKMPKGPAEEAILGLMDENDQFSDKKSKSELVEAKLKVAK